MSSSHLLRYVFILWLLVSGLLLLSIRSEGELLPSVSALHALLDGTSPADTQIPSKQMVSPEQLNQMLKSQNPLVLQVGPRSMYQQAHIPGAEYIGGTSEPEGLAALRARLKSLPKDKLIVVYCGCCPWDKCPNIHSAYRALRDLGYTNARVLYIANNFGTDWVKPGYPVAKDDQ